MNIFRKLYNWTLSKAGHKNSSWFLILVSFAESSFFPIPPDILLIPMILAKKLRAWFYAFICTISSVLGGLFGYAIGYYFYSSIGSIIIETYGLTNSFNSFENYYNQYGIWIVFGAGFTPFPFKFITIASGVFSLNIFLFIIVAFIGRGFRFYIISFLLYMFGDILKNIIEKYFNQLTILFFVLLIGSILLLKLI